MGDEPTLSFADLIVIAGGVAIEEAAGPGNITIGFCGGRTDDTGRTSREEREQLFGHLDRPILRTHDREINSVLSLEMDELAVTMGLTRRDLVALLGANRSMGTDTGLGGPSTASPGILDNSYFEVLLGRQWTKRTQGGFESGTLRMLSTDIAIRTFPELRVLAEEFSESNEAFLSAVSVAW